VQGETRKRSDLSERRLTEALRAAGAARLAESGEVWVVLDSSDLRKPYAEQMEALMQVRDLDGKIVPGYRVLNALGIAPGARGLLYHRLFSSQEPGFESEPREYRQAVRQVGQVLNERPSPPEVTWILDRAFDDEALWGVIWEEQGHHLVVRLKHLDRVIRAPDSLGRWRKTKVEPYGYRLPEVARLRTKLKVRLGKQTRARTQEVTVVVYAGPMRVQYRAGRSTYQEPRTCVAWLVRIQILGTNMRLWLMTDWPINTPDDALRIFQMYRMRWAIEDAFKFIKQSLGWEEVQVLSLEAVRFLVALAAVAAAFLFEWGASLDWDAVQLLAQLGGWVPSKSAPPGKIILTRGLRRLLDLLATRSILDAYLDQHGKLPPQIADFLPDDFF
jgi:hypothetical protein